MKTITRLYMNELHFDLATGHSVCVWLELVVIVWCSRALLFEFDYQQDPFCIFDREFSNEISTKDRRKLWRLQQTKAERVPCHLFQCEQLCDTSIENFKSTMAISIDNAKGREWITMCFRHTLIVEKNLTEMHSLLSRVSNCFLDVTTFSML